MLIVWSCVKLVINKQKYRILRLMAWKEKAKRRYWPFSITQVLT